jgi:hypothetical protein
LSLAGAWRTCERVSAVVARDWDELGVCLGEVGVLVHAAWTAVLVDVVFLARCGR